MIKKGLGHIFELLTKKNLPFLFYSKPGSESVRIVVHSNDYVELTEEIVQKNEPGIIYRPFDINQMPKFIRASFAGEAEDFLWAKFELLPDCQNTNNQSLEKELAPDISKEDYLQNINGIVNELKNGKVSKVVLSRTKTLRNTKSPIQIFTKLVSDHNSAFCYLLRTGEGELWFGASPEIILEHTINGFKTVALAGTVRNEDQDDLFSEKNKEEQSFVTNYILEKLKDNEAKNVKFENPVSYRASNVSHIKTDISFNLDADDLKSVCYFAEMLHPTPAVAGTPTECSVEVIRKFEQHDRGLYAGYLGPVNVLGDTSLFVNIRSARYYNDQVRLYVGGGITRDSDAEMEWEETENKAKLIERILE